MKAIIIAAGMGSRLGNLTQEIPKCLLDIGGESILSHQLKAFKANGVEEISLIKGYKGEKINFQGINYYKNEHFQKNNILLSLMCAEEEMKDAFIATYSDIYFETGVVSKLLAVKEDIAIVVDLDWQGHYVGRTAQPIEEAENVIFDKNHHVIRIGKNVCNDGSALGEFIGMFKCTQKGAQVWKEYFHKARRVFNDKPFMEARVFEKAYVTDMIQYLAKEGVEIKCVFIKRGWFEIDTPEDLDKAADLLEGKKE